MAFHRLAEGGRDDMVVDVDATGGRGHDKSPDEDNVAPRSSAEEKIKTLKMLSNKPMRCWARRAVREQRRGGSNGMRPAP
jgi:hypothetical protein